MSLPSHEPRPHVIFDGHNNVSSVRYGRLLFLYQRTILRQSVLSAAEILVKLVIVRHGGRDRTSQNSGAVIADVLIIVVTLRWLTDL